MFNAKLANQPVYTTSGCSQRIWPSSADMAGYVLNLLPQVRGLPRRSTSCDSMNGTTSFPVVWFFDIIIGPRHRLCDLHVVKPDAASIAKSGQPLASSFTIGRLVSSTDRSSSERSQESTTTRDGNHDYSIYTAPLCTNPGFWHTTGTLWITGVCA